MLQPRLHASWRPLPTANRRVALVVRASSSRLEEAGGAAATPGTPRRSSSSISRRRSRFRDAAPRPPSPAGRSDTGRSQQRAPRPEQHSARPQQPQQSQQPEPLQEPPWYAQPPATAGSSSGADRAPAQPAGSQDSSSSSSSGSSSSSPPARGSSEALSLAQLVQLRAYMAHLLQVNQSLNLTAIRDPGEAWQRHVEDSLALVPAIEAHLPAAHRQQQQQQKPLHVIDVGTGAGLPGMVLAVARPHWQVTLLDSLRKRCDFLRSCVSLLGLTNVRVVWARAEEGGQQPELREAHDLAVARAVAELRVLAELCLPFVAPGGLWVAAKGASPQAEVAAAGPALAKLGGELRAVELVDSWAPEGQRTAVVVAKARATPPSLPRAPGTPSRRPL